MLRAERHAVKRWTSSRGNWVDVAAALRGWWRTSTRISRIPHKTTMLWCGDADHFTPPDLRCDRGWLRRLGRLGGEAAGRSRREGRARRLRRVRSRRRLHRSTCAAFELKYRDRADEVIRKTRPVQKDCYACMEYNYDWFANDLEEPYTTPRRQAVQLAGPPARDRRAHQRLGPPELSPERSRFQGRKSHDGYGDDWPLSYEDLAPYYDIVEDYVGISGQAEGVPELPDGQFQPAMPMTCAETQLRTRVKAEARTHRHHRPHGEPHQADQRPRRLPLLRALRARLHDALVLQLRVHHRRRRARRPATARSSRTRWSARC